MDLIHLYQRWIIGRLYLIYIILTKKQVKFYSKKRTYSFKIIGCVFWSRYLNEYLFSIKKYDIV